MNGVHEHNTVHKPYNPGQIPGVVLDFAAMLLRVYIRTIIVGQRLARASEITYLLLYWKETHRDGSTAAGGEGEEVVRAAARGRGPGQLQA